MEIRRVTADEWRELRDTRLSSLQESPDAFGGTYEGSVVRPEEWWREWARTSAESDGQAMFLAWDGAAPIGIAGTFEDAGERVVIAMWVAPARRGEGIGRQLLDAVVEFIKAHGATEVVLGVVDGNDAARALYERYGFVDTGVANPLREGESLIVRELKLEL